jgi:hypothetical protein
MNMKKNLLLLALLPFVTLLHTVANPITPDAAWQKAKAFFLQKGKQVQPLPLKAPGQTGTMQAEAPYYIFNAEQQGGFVIISGDDATDEVLAWSDRGCLDIDNLPDNVRGWLENYTRQLELIKAGKAQPVRQNAIGIHEFVETKLKSQWDQRAPYNNQTPTDGGQHCVTGCVATALAQLMNYHKWPQDSTPVIPSYTTNTKRIVLPALDSVKFDWTNMRDTYSTYGTGYTQAEGDAVAQLMRYCGQSVQMDYTKDGSAASLSLAPASLKNYFGYDQDLISLAADDYGLEEWDGMIYRELTVNGPVAYSGQSSADNAHAFVIDGYLDGLYHVNWGWSGRADGYFRLFVLNPPELGTGGGTSIEGYRYNQSALFNFRPDNAVTDDAYVRTLPNLVPAGKRISFAGSAVTFQFANKSTQNEAYDLALVIQKNDGYQTLAQNSQGFDVGLIYSMSYNVNSILNMSVVKTQINANGFCKLTLLSKLPSSSVWTPVYDQDTYFLLKREGSTVIPSVYCSNPLDAIDVAATDFVVTDSLMKGDNAKVSFIIGGGTKDFKSDVWVFMNTSTPTLYTQEEKKFLALTPGDAETVDFSVTTKRAGEHIVLVAADELGTKILGSYNFTVYETANIKKMKVASATTDSTAWFRIVVRNDGEMTYDRHLKARLYQEEAVFAELVTDLALESGATEKYEFEFGNLQKETDYTVRFFVDNSPFSDEEQEVFGSSVTVTTNNLYELVEADDAEYDIVGRTATVRAYIENCSRRIYERPIMARLYKNQEPLELVASQEIMGVLPVDSVSTITVTFDNLEYATKYKVCFYALLDPESDAETLVAEQDLMLQNDLMASNCHTEGTLYPQEEGQLFVTLTSPEQGYHGMVDATFRHTTYTSVRRYDAVEVNLNPGESQEYTFSFTPPYEGIWTTTFTNGETESGYVQAVANEQLVNVGELPLDATITEVEGVKRLSYEQTVKISVVANQRYNNYVYLFCGHEGFAKRMEAGNRRLTLDAGESTTVSFSLPTDWVESGDYKLWVVCKNSSYYEMLCADTTVTFLPKPADYNLAVDSSHVQADSTAVLSVVIRNNGESDYCDPLYVEVDGDDEQLLTYFIDAIPVGETRKVSIRIDSLEVGIHAVKLFYAQKPEYDKNLQLLAVMEVNMPDLSGISVVQMPGSKRTVYYDMNGRRIATPTQRGVYIVQTEDDRLQGRKVRKIVVK